MEIELRGKHGRGRTALIDEVDWPLVADRKWHVNGGYVRSVKWGEERGVFLHRLIMNPPPGMVVDHINGDRLDNRRDNLRLATHSQNAASATRPRAATGFIGVRFVGSQHAKPYVAMLKHKRKWHYLGYHPTAEDAARAYDAAARRLRGEFTRLNFPEQ